MRIDDLRPSFVRIESTAGTISNPGITYNQAGVTYNQIGLTYGGFAGETGNAPRFKEVRDL